jgi:hypothetical protein
VCGVLSSAQAIPGLSPVPWWGTLFPLAVVLLVNGVKEAFDDYWRHKSDEQVRADVPLEPWTLELKCSSRQALVSLDGLSVRVCGVLLTAVCMWTMERDLTVCPPAAAACHLLLPCGLPQVNHRWVTALKEDGDQRIHWKSLQVCELFLVCFCWRGLLECLYESVGVEAGLQGCWCFKRVVLCRAVLSLSQQTTGRGAGAAEQQRGRPS